MVIYDKILYLLISLYVHDIWVFIGFIGFSYLSLQFTVKSTRRLRWHANLVNPKL
jgi:hypothetical protein